MASGKLSKNLPPKANKKANAISPRKIINLTKPDNFLTEEFAINFKKK